MLEKLGEALWFVGKICIVELASYNRILTKSQSMTLPDVTDIPTSFLGDLGTSTVFPASCLFAGIIASLTGQLPSNRKKHSKLGGHP